MELNFIYLNELFLTVVSIFLTCYLFCVEICFWKFLQYLLMKNCKNLCRYQFKKIPEQAFRLVEQAVDEPSSICVF